MDQAPIKIIQEVESYEPVAPKEEVSIQLLKYSLAYTQDVSHDFKQSRQAHFVY